jgi:ATP-dependent helicase/nuclease subunit B
MSARIRTIAASLPFLDTLAHFLLREEEDPLRFSARLIFLPSQRAVAALKESFLRASDGAPMLLPEIRSLNAPLDDLTMRLEMEAPAGDMATPGASFRRAFLLARLVQRFEKSLSGQDARLDHALRLADDLAGLLDEMERHGALLDALEDLVPERFARHWQVTADFLGILSQHWPQIAREENIRTPQQCRHEQVRLLAEGWRIHPPARPVLLAGLHHVEPALLPLFETLLAFPENMLVLHGFENTENETPVSETHPQFGLRRLLLGLKIAPESVRPLEGTRASHPARETLLRHLTASEIAPTAPENFGEALQGFTCLTARSAQEEATMIALMLRETLETPGKRAALVTQDRALARRVAAHMKRWSIAIDDSAGTPLRQMPAAVFLRLIAESAQGGTPPLSILALCKHPLALGGLERPAWLEQVRRFELRVRQGGGRYEGLQGFADLAYLCEEPQDATLRDFILHFNELFAPFARLFEAGRPLPLREMLQAHLDCAERLAGEGLWSGPEAPVLSEWRDEVTIALASLPQLEVTPDAYPDIFDSLLANAVYRPAYGLHPRLQILGAYEARLQQWDRIVIGGMNEGSWPAIAPADPWFNRPMRRQIGLALPEEAIGLAAHDFYTLAAGATDAIVTRAAKTAGAPATPARWLMRLELLLSQAAHREATHSEATHSEATHSEATHSEATHSEATHSEETPSPWQNFAALLDQPEAVRPASAPAPAPPAKARPVSFTLSEVEALIGNPYRYYAERLLRLRELSAISDVPSPAEFGQAAHKALENFVRRYPETLPEDAPALLAFYGQEALQGFFSHPAARIVWWPRFLRLAEWFLAEERRRRRELAHVWSEVQGSVALGSFTLRGRADRIEREKSGAFRVIDYKTGQAPKESEVRKGLRSQLPLFGLILQEGETLLSLTPPVAIAALEYWQLRHAEGGEIRSIAKEDPQEEIQRAKDGVEALLETYADPASAYRPAFERKARGYDIFRHLARMQEWEG